MHVSIAAQPSHLFVLCSWKLKRLLDPQDNQHIVRGSQNVTLEWSCNNRSDIHYCCAAMIHGL
jgi:hypothetical protein